MSDRLTKEQFVSKAVAIHGSRYSYEKSNYNNGTTKLRIICKEHGEFWQRPRYHLDGSGCPECSVNKRSKDKGARCADAFIENARKIHGNKYNYEKVEYIDSKSKVRIFCKNHGEFLQSPSVHLSGYGCKKCYYERRSYSNKDFVVLANKKHGRKYTYKKCRYKGSAEKICITCPKHGEFWQVASEHLKGSGCQKCARESRSLKMKGFFLKTTVDFVKNANVIHKGKYNYSQCVYLRCDTKVKIICPRHGVFYQTPTAHLRGYGCRKCSTEITSKKLAMSLSDFIKNANKKHKRVYSYSKIKVLKSQIDRVEIVCKKHGSFWQRAAQHLQGQGCKKCGWERLARDRRTTVPDFIVKARKIHGNKYVYDKIKSLKNAHQKLEIICPKHGSFLQCSNSHLSGQGCPKCQHVTLKDGTTWHSKVEAYYYLKLKARGIKFIYNKEYGFKRKKYKFDFYFPKFNTYVEITGFHKRMNGPNKYKTIWKKYSAIIRRKREFVQHTLCAQFRFIQLNLNYQQRKVVCRNIAQNSS